MTIEASRQPRVRARSFALRRIGLMLVALVAAGVMAVGSPTPVAATNASEMASLVIDMMNADRIANGLVPYRSWSPLTSLAVERAGRMAAKHTLSHSAAGPNIGSTLTARGVKWYGWGEIIGMSSYMWGTKSARNIYSMWLASPPHRALMLSSTYNYVGVGFAYHSSDKTTWASVVFSESPDHTPPIVRSDDIASAGTSVSFDWSGWDPRLQSHSATLRSYDVQYRMDSGSWSTIRNDTTATSISIADRQRGHWYGLRVQAADTKGNLSSWTSERRVWLP